MNKTLSFFLFSTGILCATSFSARANLLVNGDFELPVVQPGNANGWVTFFASQTVGAGWIVDENSVDVHAREFSTPWTPASGNQGLDLTGGNAARIHQDVTVDPGASYLLSFYMSANLAFAPTVTSLNVYADGNLLATESFDRTGASFADMRWEHHQYTITAPDPSLTIAFQSLTDGCCGPAIDNVQLTLASTVPEGGPSFLYNILLIGVLGTFQAIRRRG